LRDDEGGGAEVEEEEGRAAGPETIRPAFRRRGPAVEKEELESEVLASFKLGAPAKEGRRLVLAVRNGPIFEIRRAARRPGERDSVVDAEDIGTSRESAGFEETMGAKRPEEPGAIEKDGSVGGKEVLARSTKGSRGLVAKEKGETGGKAVEEVAVSGRNENGREGSEVVESGRVVRSEEVTEEDRALAAIISAARAESAEGV